jgi:hypothetical protein
MAKTSSAFILISPRLSLSLPDKRAGLLCIHALGRT